MISHSSGVISELSNILPLDCVPSTNIGAAWGCRLLRRSYKGFLMNITRSSDNATTDVSPDGTGIISLNSPVSAGGNLGTWIGSANGTINQLYDQSGNGNNGTQATALLKPQIISSGTIITRNSKPSILFSGTTVLSVADSSSIDFSSTMTFGCIIYINSFSGLNVNALIDKRQNNAAQTGYHYFVSPNNFGCQWNSTAASGYQLTASLATGGPLTILTCTNTVSSGGTMYQSLTNLGNGTLSQSGSAVSSNTLLIGGHQFNPALYWNGYMSELYLLNNIASKNQLNFITNNQRNFYNIS